MALEQLIASIQSSSSSVADLTQLLAQLKAQETVLQQHVPHLGDALQPLNPVTHSLGYLYLLETKASAGMPAHEEEPFVDLVTRFLQVCEPSQIRMAPEKFASLCRKFKEKLLARQQPRRAILPLRAAVRALAPTAEHLTPVHADCLQACLLSKCYNAAVSLLDEDVYVTDPATTALTPRDFLLYCYYGGMIHIGRRRYEKAIDLLLHAITGPTMVANAITVACFKKYALVSLIHTGQLPSLPKYTASVLQRSLKTEAAAYTELGNAYTVKNAAEIATLIAGRQQEYQQDNNWGLAKLVGEAASKRAIQRLTQTYVTLSLADIASTAGLADAAEAENYILRMVDAGEIFAQVDAAQGMVRFLEDTERYDQAGTVQALDSQIKQATFLAEKLQALDHEVSLDKAYLSRVTMRERSVRYDEAPEFAAEPALNAVTFPPA